ncbi:MAG: hypothetical protein ACTTIC_02330 [Helicobacteraceae bacterium]
MHIDEGLILWGVSLLVMVILYIYIIIKNAAIKNRLNSYEASFEELNKSIYRLEKGFDERLEEIKAKLEAEIKEPIFSSIESIKQSATIERNRVSNLEKISIPMNPTLDENRAISLFKSGNTIPQIAKELMCNESEINFLLKVRGLV